VLPSVGEWSASGTLTFTSPNVDAYTFLRTSALHSDIIGTIKKVVLQATGDKALRVVLTGAESTPSRQARRSEAKSIDVEYYAVFSELDAAQEEELTASLGSVDTFNNWLFVSIMQFSEMTCTKITGPTYLKNSSPTIAPTQPLAASGRLEDKTSESSPLPMIIGAIVAIIVIIAVTVVIVRMTRKSDTNSSDGKQAAYVNPAFDKNGGIAGGVVGVDETMTITDRNRRKSVRTEQLQAAFEETKGLEATSNFTTGRKDNNESKNRFQDIIPYNHNRVLLETIPGVEGSDYINASYVPGYEEDETYIVTQGPLEGTVPDFYRMVWEQDAGVVVMLTATEQNGKEMSFQYWPDRLHTMANFEGWSVKMTQLETESYYMQRSLLLTNTATGEKRKIEQFQFLQWTGSEAPSSAQPLLHFRSEVAKALSKTQRSGPLVVHDDAGVGQAGAFVCIDKELKRFEEEGEVDVFETVVELRKKRAYMVLEPAQYLFIHEAIIEAVENLPAKPPPDVPDQVAQFLQNVVIPPQFSDFDFGTNGRKIVRLNQFALLQRTQGEQVTRPVILAVCSDVVVIAVAGASGNYEIAATPLSRMTLQVTDVQHDWDEPILCLQSGPVRVVIEASCDEEKQEWIEYLNTKAEFQATQELHGPRLIPLRPSSRADVASLLGILDPAAAGSREELEAEYTVIPKVTLDETFLEDRAPAPAEGAGAYNEQHEAAGGYLQVGANEEAQGGAPVEAAEYGATLDALAGAAGTYDNVGAGGTYDNIAAGADAQGSAGNLTYETPAASVGNAADSANETQWERPAQPQEAGFQLGGFQASPGQAEDVGDAHAAAEDAVQAGGLAEEGVGAAPIFAMLKKRRSSSQLSTVVTSPTLAQPAAPFSSFNTLYASPGEAEQGAKIVETSFDTQAILGLGGALGANSLAASTPVPVAPAPAVPLDPLDTRMQKAVESVGLLGNSGGSTDIIQQRKLARASRQGSVDSLKQSGVFAQSAQPCSFLGNCKCPNCA